MTDDGVKLEFSQFPVNGEESIMASVVFGPANPDFALLLTVDQENGLTRVIVGNGPPPDQAPETVAAILHTVADIVEELGGNEEYWAAVQDNAE